MRIRNFLQNSFYSSFLIIRKSLDINRTFCGCLVSPYMHGLSCFRIFASNSYCLLFPELKLTHLIQNDNMNSSLEVLEAFELYETRISLGTKSCEFRLPHHFVETEPWIAKITLLGAWVWLKVFIILISVHGIAWNLQGDTLIPTWSQSYWFLPRNSKNLKIVSLHSHT